MARIFNFSAGPSTLPVPVLEQAQAEMLDYRGTGMSVMEMSHRSAAFEGIIGQAEADLRTLLNVPDDYRVLFLQGGASLQFAMAPMNLPGEWAYAVTGTWGEKAVESGGGSVVWSGQEDGYRNVPKEIEGDADFVHITTNETIQGVQYYGTPTAGGLLVADMSSDFLAYPLDVRPFGLIYAGAQKNLGPAGLTVVIVRDDLLAAKVNGLPPILDYRVHAKNGSLYNTPPAWSIYVSGLGLNYLLENGGLEAAHERNARKAAILYEAIDGSGGFYQGHAAPEARSHMNVVFTLADPHLTDAFVKGAEERGMDGLKGHRSVGGIRASIYNAFPEEGCVALAEWMGEFAGSRR
ncbi:3-phosphoserine/phosphohydroxythreonine transaminase [bacterium]|nr:MAG: 3-phosphoserine/phosphohydroxythreonine transaminase [bacterium]